MQILNRGSSRSVKAKINICWMLLIKGGNILTGLLLVPMTLEYVDSGTYGLWIALSSMVAWISFFDIGINNGLKNHLAKALATGEYDKARTLVSTTYALLALIFIPLMFVLLCLSPYVDWFSLLNIRHAASLLPSVCIIIAYFCINFILSTINIILIADQRPAEASFRTLVQQVVSLVIIFILTKTTQGSLLNLCLALCVSPVIVITLFNVTLFRGRYRRIAPGFKSIDFRQAQVLMKLGIQFFIIQIAGIIQYQMINFFIIRYYGATDVTAYNITYKYFNVLFMTWSILITPVWVGVTDAVSCNDFRWIRDILNKYQKLFFAGIAIGLVMLALSQRAYNLWVGDSVEISQGLSLTVLLYNLAMMFGNVFVHVLNGCGKLRVQVVACLVSPLIFIGTFYLLRNCFAWGVTSILIAAIVSNFNGLILAPIQCRRMLRANTL